MSSLSTSSPNSLSQPKKSILILSLIILLGLIFGLLIWWYISHAQPKNVYLKEAKAILDQIDSQTDSRGFYGSAQHCTWIVEQNQWVCNIGLYDFLGDGQLYASHTQTLAVIWARYWYYIATKDANELIKLHHDLENMYNLVVNDDNWVLQSNRFNCLLMQDLVNSDFLEPEYKDMAKDICGYAMMDYYPEGYLAYDQHDYHTLYKFMSFPENKTTAVELAVEPYSDRYIPESEIVNYQVDELVEEIKILLSNYVDYQSIAQPANIDPYMAYVFITRELMGAIDQIASQQIEHPDNPDWIDYLLLTKETFEWFVSATDPDDFSFQQDADACLLRINLEYFLRHFAPDFPADKKDLLYDYLPSSTFTSPYCLVADHQLFGTEIDKKWIMDNITYNNSTYEVVNWPAGYVTDRDDQDPPVYYFHIYLNALTVGLLSQ